MKKFKGVYTALITPMKDNGDPDYDGYRALINFQIEAEIDGLLSLGTTGETPALDDDEEEKLIKIAVKENAGRVPLIVGAGSNSTRHMEAYVKRARDLGADAAMVVTPYYNKPNDSGLLKHFEIAAAAGLPIIVYNVADRTGRNIPASLMEKIAAIPGIAGVKEASGDITQIMDVIDRIALPRKNTANPFWVLSGDDFITLPLLALGGNGLVSVISNIVPKKVKSLADACLSGNFKEGKKLHYELLPLMKNAFIETNPVPVKTAMNWIGLPAGPVRLPLGPLTKNNEQVLRKTLETLGILDK